MEYENYANRTSISMNLNEAQRYMSKLKSHLSTIKHQNHSTMDIQHEMEFDPNDDTLLGVIQTKIEKKKMEWFVTRLLSHDINRLKTLLHHQNSLLGVSERLTDVEFLKAEIAFYQELSRECGNHPTVANLPMVIKKFREIQANRHLVSRYDSVDTNIQLFDQDTIDAKIVELKRIITQKENEIVQRNNSHKFSCNLSDHALTAIGIGNQGSPMTPPFLVDQVV
jgi:hypothetical protein